MSKVTLRNIAKNLKKSSKVHAKQSKQIENIMKKSPTRQNFMGKVTGKLERKRKGPVKPKFPMDPRGRRPIDDIDPNLIRDRGPYKPNQDVKRLEEIIKKEGYKLPKKSMPNIVNTPKFNSGKKPGFPMKSKNVASAMKMKTSPALVKLSASCKALAKRKFKVYPSAYANMYAAKMQRKGKC